jgi:putative two-component system response regulator
MAAGIRDHVLIVDDDTNVLDAVKRIFRGDEDIAILTASSAQGAMQIIRETTVPVIVSDYQMPGMSGVEFLEWAKTEVHESMRILLTGNTDFAVALNSINRCEVYRFITKPWNTENFKATIRNALQRYRMVATLKSGDEAKLLSLVQTIELKDPYTRGHSERVARYGSLIIDGLGASDEEKKDIRYGCLLHDCGKIGIPEAILNKPGSLDSNQSELMKNHPRWGSEVAIAAGMNQRIVNMVLHHHERFDGRGYPGGLAGAQIPREARIAALADFYDALASDRPYRKAMGTSEAMKLILKERALSFDPQLADLFVEQIEKQIP